MENNQGKKPLRQAANAAKDIYNTYVKNTDRNIPIDSNDDKMEDLEEKISAAFADQENDENEVELKEEELVVEEEIVEETTDNQEDNIQQYLDEINYLKEQLARKTAEMENMRRRMEKEKLDLISYSNEKLMSNLLEIPDTIKQALNASEKTNDINSIKKGVELIFQKTIKLFENAKVVVMEDATGQEFNVDYHDALMQTPNEEIPEGHIAQILQDGYMIGDKVLRHAKVITSSGPAE
jgi:molecular chaperone GrpE